MKMRWVTRRQSWDVTLREAPAWSENDSLCDYRSLSWRDEQTDFPRRRSLFGPRTTEIPLAQYQQQDTIQRRSRSGVSRSMSDRDTRALWKRRSRQFLHIKRRKKHIVCWRSFYYKYIFLVDLYAYKILSNIFVIDEAREACVSQ